MSRPGFGFLAFTLLFTALVGVPERLEAAGPERIKLRVSGLPDPSATEPVAVASLNIQKEFLRRNPRVDLVSAEGIRLENVVSEVTTVMMVAGGIAPDVIAMNFRSIDTFVRKGIVMPISEFLDAEAPGVREEVLRRIPSQVIPVVDRTGPDSKRQLYGLPMGVLSTGLYFNIDLFQRAGLPLRAPNDWNELTKFLQKLKELGPKISPLYLGAGSSASHNLMSFLWSAGADAVVEKSPDEWRAAFDSPEAVTAYEFYYRLVEADRLAVRSGGLSATQTPTTGMFFGYVGDAIAFDPQKFGFGPVPMGPTGIRGAEINARVLGVFSQIKDPEVRQAAWEYVKFMASRDAEKIKVQTMVDMGLAAQVNPVMLREFGFDEYLQLMPAGMEEAFQQSLITGKPEPFGQNCNLVYTEMTYPLDQILLSRKIAELWSGGNFEAARAEMAEILKRAVTKTNERMLGHVPPEDMQVRRVVAVVVVIAILVGFVFVGWNVSSAFSGAAHLMSRPVVSKGILPWMCLAPAVILVVVWQYIPLIRGTGMAFLDYQLILPSKWVGLDNFANVLFDAAFWKSIKVTFYYAAWTLTAGFLTPILLAYALHLIPKQKVLFRILYYLPAVISSAAVFILWRELFGAESVLNHLLRLFGFEARRPWTEDPNLAMITCILPAIWAGAGPGCLIYLAALKTIPVEQFEAAEIDGASFLMKTRLIVFPGLKGLIIINFIGAIAAAFHGANNILIMTGGGPNGATEVTALLLFFEAFTRLRFGYATAMAWIIASLLIGITMMQLKRLSRMEFKTAK